MSTTIGRFWHREGGRIRCDLCPHACLLLAGQSGFCSVREGSEDGVVLTTYGMTSGACLDPIEKKPLYHFYPGTATLSFGTSGCNLGCSHCEIWPRSQAHDALLASHPADPVDIARVARAVGARSVAFTYNDPIVYAEYAIDTARACRSEGVKTIAVTAGYLAPSARPEFFAALDAASIDLKAFDDTFYKSQCGGHLQPVLETIAYAVREAGTWVELTALIIPGLNDADAAIDRMVDWIGGNLSPDTPLHLNALHPAADLRAFAATPPATLTRARDRARAAGLHHVYVGDGTGDGPTVCRACETLLIERKQGKITTWKLADGCCRACGRELAGWFDESPGTWGELRVPLVISPRARELPPGAHEAG